MQIIYSMNIIIFYILIFLIRCQEKIGHFKIKNHNRTNEIKNNFSPLNNIYKIKKNVILGIIQEYSVTKVLPFFSSIIYSNITNCDIVMFVRNVSSILINYLNSIGVIVYQISNIYNNITKPTHLRWKMFLNFLEENKSKYNLVFSVDVRDSIFQKDIFKNFDNYNSFLGVTLEDGTLDQIISKHNIIKLVGIMKHNKIKNERIICMGTVIGTLKEFLDFSNIMWEKLKSYKFPLSDQGLANFLFYYDKIMNNCLLKSDNNGPIMTIGLSQIENITLDYQDNILNYKGEIASVVHQYDRKENITIKIINKFLNQLPKSIKNEIYDLNNLYDMIYDNYSKKAYLKVKNRNIISYILLFKLFTIILFIKLLILILQLKK